MVFKRRKRLPITRKIREGLFPEKGWSRAAEYMMARIKRLPDSPKNISLSLLDFSEFDGGASVVPFAPLVPSMRLSVSSVPADGYSRRLQTKPGTGKQKKHVYQRAGN